MPLSIPLLKTAIKNALSATFPIENDAQAEAFALALATAIIDHFKNNAVVTVSGVQAGGSTAGGTIT